MVRLTVLTGGICLEFYGTSFLCFARVFQADCIAMVLTGRLNHPLRLVELEGKVE